MIQKSSSLLAGVLLALPFAASAQFFTDNFSTDSSANYSINGSSASYYEFGWGYTQAGIPIAPRTVANGTVGGLLTIVNDPARASTGVNDALTFIPNAVVDGNFKMTFDIWMNYLGPLAEGGTGSTEFMMAGAGISGFNANGTPTDGTWLGLNGDAFGSYRLYENDANIAADPGVFVGGSAVANDPYYTAQFPGGL